MKNFVYSCIALTMLCLCFAACQKEIPKVGLKQYDTADKFTPDEMKWVDYKIKNKIKFVSNKSTDTVDFVVENVRVYNYYQSYHFAIIGRVYIVNTNKDARITSIGWDLDKNTSSTFLTGKMENNVSYVLYNEKAATGLFPSVSASAGGSCITLDKRDPSQCRSEFIGKLTIREKVYDNVYKQTMQPNPNIGATFLYVNRDNGILRIDFEDGEVWERVQ